MKYAEIAELSDDQIVQKIAEEKQGLTKLRFAHAVSSVENPMRIRHARKDIARLNTELSKRNIVAGNETTVNEIDAPNSAEAKQTL